MLDLYKRLDLPQNSPDEAIRAVLPEIAPVVGAAAREILLDPRRRAVYDRNYRLLRVIAQLRSDLGLNYTRFWSRKEFKDFWQTPVFEMPQSPAPAKRRVDKIMIERAFHTAKRVHHHSRHHIARWGNWWVAAIVSVAGAVLAMTLWKILR